MAPEAGVLVGRERELAAIDRYLDGLDSDRSALAIEGEPGIGKTSLWRAGVDLAAARGLRVLAARPAENERALSFATLTDLLADLGDTIDSLPRPQRRALRVALLLEQAGDAVPDPRAVGAAVLASLRLLARPAPLVVAIDDMQWMDAPSAKALGFAFRRLEDDPVSLLATVRLAPDERWPVEVEGAVGDRLTRLSPRPLSVAALYELVRSRLGVSLSRPTLVRVHETAAGNPFFALELARALQDLGAEPGPGEPLPVPRDLRDVVRGRLGGLPQAVAETLLYAAALSRPTVALLEAALHDAGRAERDLTAAVEAGIVDLDGDRVRFSHPLLASIHYSTFARRRLGAVHRRLADVVDDLEERARHLARGVERPDGEVAGVLEAAASRAKRRGASVAAAALAEEAFRRTPSADVVDRRRRLLEAANAHHLAGDTRRALALLDEELRDSQPGPDRAELLLARGEISFEGEHTNVGLDLYRQALAEVGEGDDALRARILVGLAMAGAGYQETWEASARYAAEAVEVARRVGDAATLARALGRLAALRSGLERPIETELFEEALALEESVGGLELDYGPTANYAETLVFAGELDRARVLLERLCARGRESGDAAANWPLFRLAGVEFDAGNWARAEELAREAQDLTDQSGREAASARGLMRLAHLKAARGEVDEARALGEAAFEITESRGWKSGGPRGVLGFLELSLENYQAAYDMLIPAIERYRSLGSKLIGQIFDATEALAGLGKVEQGYEMLAPAEEAARVRGAPWAIAAAGRARGLLQLAGDDVAAAESTLADALTASEASGMPLELARSLLALGTARRRAGKKRAARETLGRALVIFEELGAPIWAERTRRELARIGGRSAPRTALSGTEAEIAALVGAGRSNREVAEALHLSPKTVEWNLSKIYRKLGVRSRAELAARR